MAKKLWLETDYFDSFRCKGGSCRNSCCEGWQICVSMQNYFRMIGMDCSDELHRRLECAFSVPREVSAEHYRSISPNWRGVCPLHDEDGLCALHRECGAEALPEICRVYPRSMKCGGGQNEACCSASCEAVVELLMQEDRLNFCMREMDGEPEYSREEPVEMKTMGFVFTSIMQDRSLPLSERIRRICRQAGGAGFDVEADLPAGIEMLMEALNALKADFFSLQRYGEEAFDRYNGSDAARNYSQDAALFEQRFPRWQVWFENILANHLFYEDVPCVDARLEIRDVCAGLCLLYGAMRALSVAHTRESGSQEDLVDALAGLFRMAEHSAFYYNAHVLLFRPAPLLAL